MKAKLTLEEYLMMSGNLRCEEMWLKTKDFEGYEMYSAKEKFDGIVYNLIIYVWEQRSTELFWIGLSSGNKRKDLRVFEDKPKKIPASLKGLLWAKDMILKFPEYYGNKLNKKQYLCISWADSRRRDIYSRLEKYGFKFDFIGGQKALIKEV